jgi:hypothetical protein
VTFADLLGHAVANRRAACCCSRPRACDRPVPCDVPCKTVPTHTSGQSMCLCMCGCNDAAGRGAQHTHAVPPHTQRTCGRSCMQCPQLLPGGQRRPHPRAAVLARPCTATHAARRLPQQLRRSRNNSRWRGAPQHVASWSRGACVYVLSEWRSPGLRAYRRLLVVLFTETAPAQITEHTLFERPPAATGWCAYVVAWPV